MNTFVFDIETVPDVAGGRRIHGLGDLNDQDTAEAMFELRRQQTGHDFLRLHQHRIVTISVVLRTPDRLKVWSLGNEQSSESELLGRFFKGIEHYVPILVSWNGGGFDLPVIHYRSLYHGVSAPRYWDQGDADSAFRWNNYLNRYHMRHTDLMEVLALYQSRAYAPLDEIAALLGFPGKMGMSGAKVWDAVQAGEINKVRNYCETDVLNTYLVYCRFKLMRGDWNQAEYETELAQVKTLLSNSEAAHLQEFLAEWVAIGDI